MKSVYNTRGGSPTLDSTMTPMIDVVFLLLIFFLTSASFNRPEQQLASASAKAPEAKPQGTDREPTALEPQRFEDIVIKINMAGAIVQYTLQSQPVGSFEELAHKTEELLAIRNDIPIIVDPANNVQAGEAIRVYDMIRRNGAGSVFLVAR